jgi:hypothetical protein
MLLKLLPNPLSTNEGQSIKDARPVASALSPATRQLDHKVCSGEFPRMVS